MENIIIDTDLGFDCDDGGAIAIANMLKNNGLINILAIVHSVNKSIGGEAIKAINSYYGNNDIPIGVSNNYPINVDNFYDEFYAKFHYKDSFDGWPEKPTFYKLFNGLNLPNNDFFHFSDEVVVDTLNKAEDKSVTLLCIGQLNNLSLILSNKNRKKLFEKKVKKVVIMCGNFKQTDKEFLLGEMYWKGEFNIILDIKSSQNVFNSCNVPIYVLDYNEGCDVSSGESFKNDINNPVYYMYKNHGNGINFNLPSWDLLAIMFASNIFNKYFSVSNNGKIIIENGGRSIFDSNIKNNHYLISVNKSHNEMSKVINELLINKCL